MIEFEMGDVIAELGFPQKWLVWYSDEYGYRLKSCPPYVEKGVRDVKRIILKDDAERRFVKVGKWDYGRSGEVEDERV